MTGVLACVLVCAYVLDTNLKTPDSAGKAAPLSCLPLFTAVAGLLAPAEPGLLARMITSVSVQVRPVNRLSQTPVYRQLRHREVLTGTGHEVGRERYGRGRD